MVKGSAKSIRPEIELLLCCARRSMSPETTARVLSLLGEPLDWYYLLEAASRHAVIPLLSSNLERLSAVPDTARKYLRAEFQANAMRNLVLSGELIRLLRLFAANGIDALPFKGPALALVAYGDLALRTFGDLDILVRKADFYKAKAILSAEGYISFSPSRIQRDETQLQFSGDYNFMHQDGQVQLDLQWMVLSRFFSFPLSTEYLWNRREMLTMNGITLPTVSRQDLLLILCAHGTKHLWARLGWICDVAELIRSEFDWQAVVAQARELGGERMLLLGLALARDLLGAVLPEVILNRIDQDGTVSALVAQVLDRIIDERPVQEKVRLSPFHLKAKERLRDRLRYLLYMATVPTDEDLRAIDLPRPLFVLHYPLHLFRFIRTYTPKAGQLLTRRLV
jgi:hypothetical protein